MDKKGVEEIYEELHDCKRHLIKQLSPAISFTYDFGIEADWTFWEDKIKENEIRAFKAEEEADFYRDEYREAELEGRFENEEIDDLFQR